MINSFTYKVTEYYIGMPVRVILPYGYGFDAPESKDEKFRELHKYDFKTGDLKEIDIANGIGVITMDKTGYVIAFPLDYLYKYDRYTMTAYIHFPGDHSVGIWSQTYEMNFYRFTNDDDTKEYREEVRAKIKELYQLIDQEGMCYVSFDDEKEY